MARSITATLLPAILVAAFALTTTSPTSAQTTNTSTATKNSASTNATSELTDAQLGDLVGRIALYPDDLLALILPASTVPLEIVQAQRFLKDSKGQKDPQPPASLSEPVRNLLNYPEIIDQMNSDLVWTQKLGEAVYEDQQSVMDAVQRFRMMAYSAGNLKSDDKQKVEVNDQVVTIEPAQPDVIYVPRYEPTTVIYASAAPVWNYWPTPYPVYYYPYPPGHTFASGFFWGATAAWAFNWNSGAIGWGNNWHGNTNVNVNRNTNITHNTNINRNTEINRSGSASGTWNSKNNGNRATTRPGDAGFKPNVDRGTVGKGSDRLGSENRPKSGQIDRSGAGRDNSNFKPTTRPATRPSSSSGSRSSTSVASHSPRTDSSQARSSARTRSPQVSSYGGMSGKESRATSHRGQASRSAGGGHRGGGHRN